MFVAKGHDRLACHLEAPAGSSPWLPLRLGWQLHILRLDSISANVRKVMDSPFHTFGRNANPPNDDEPSNLAVFRAAHLQ